MAADSIKVYLRFRPRNRMELELKSPIAVEIASDNRSVKLFRKNEPAPKIFHFDFIFDWKTPQIKVYKTCGAELVRTMLEGYNATIFAYGQTGSGKTWTMEGAPTLENMGIIPRMVGAVFDSITEADENLEFNVQISYVEIYMERIKDLLDKSKVNLKVRQSKEKGVYLDNVTAPYVVSREEVSEIIDHGQAARAVTATKMNAGSSRSHAVFIFRVHTEDSRTGSKKMSKLMMVDLAGSEKTRKTEATGNTLEEAKMINKSLSCLGMVISALGKKKYCPYRDSKLTYLLSDSLGGNSLTNIVITGSPAKFNVDETISTCRFGTSCKAVKNKPKVNKELSIKEAKMLISKAKKREAELVKEMGSLKLVNTELLKVIEQAGLGDQVAEIIAKAQATKSSTDESLVPPEFNPVAADSAESKTDKPQKQENEEVVKNKSELELPEPESKTLELLDKAAPPLPKNDEAKVEKTLQLEDTVKLSAPKVELGSELSLDPIEPESYLTLPPVPDTEILLPEREKDEETKDEKEDGNSNRSEPDSENEHKDSVEWKVMRKQLEKRVQKLEERNTALEIHKNDLLEENLNLNDEIKTENTNIEELKLEIEKTRQQFEAINQNNQEIQLKLGKYKTEEHKWEFREQEMVFQTKKYEDEIEELKQQIETLKVEQVRLTPERRDSLSTPPSRNELSSIDIKSDEENHNHRHTRSESHLSNASVEILTPIREFSANPNFEDNDSAISYLKEENEKLNNKVVSAEQRNKLLREKLEEAGQKTEKQRKTWRHLKSRHKSQVADIQSMQRKVKQNKILKDRLNSQQKRISIKNLEISTLEVTIQAAFQMLNMARAEFQGKLDSKETENTNLRMILKRLQERKKNPLPIGSMKSTGIRKIKGGGKKKSRGVGGARGRGARGESDRVSRETHRGSKEMKGKRRVRKKTK